MLTTQNLKEKLETLSEAKLEKGTSLFQDGFRKFKKNKMALVSCIVISILFILSFLAPYTAPHRYDAGELTAQNYPPSWYKKFMRSHYLTETLEWAQKNIATDNSIQFDEEGREIVTSEDAQLGTELARPSSQNMFERSLDHLTPEGLLGFLSGDSSYYIFGTDEIGQDIFSRVIYGMRLSLFLALTVTTVSVLIGISYGAISGFFGGMIDMVMMRFVDFLFGIPLIFMIILLMVFFGRHVYLIFVGLGLIYWIMLARIVRGQVLSLKEREFVLAAVASGATKTKIIFVHIIPNVMGPVIVFSTLLVPQIMLLEAFLSFIGLGVSPPAVSLGIMLSDGAAVLSSFSWPILFPGIVFSLMIYCLNFIGDGLRDALDPKSLK
ncbi:MAG: ABC transporter permease [Bacteriovoracaceae bacterium]|nr:ABC transporter permease [Bacteriovoracaceae bacterium]